MATTAQCIMIYKTSMYYISTTKELLNTAVPVTVQKYKKNQKRIRDVSDVRLSTLASDTR